jgi:hypothetical protein
MFNLIRNQLMTQDDEGPLTGEVEVDETWHGGKMRESDKRKARERGVTVGPYAKPRATVMGFVERGGRVIAMQVESRYGYTLAPTSPRPSKRARLSTPTIGLGTAGSSSSTPTTESTIRAAST